MYAEVGFRYIMLPPPSNYDSWGCSPDGEHWAFSFCVMDDFGNLVPVDPFPTYTDGYLAYLGPTCSDVYELQFETVH